MLKFKNFPIDKVRRLRRPIGKLSETETTTSGIQLARMTLRDSSYCADQGDSQGIWGNLRGQQTNYNNGMDCRRANLLFYWLAGASGHQSSRVSEPDYLYCVSDVSRDACYHGNTDGSYESENEACAL